MTKPELTIDEYKLIYEQYIAKFENFKMSFDGFLIKLGQDKLFREMVNKMSIKDSRVIGKPELQQQVKTLQRQIREDYCNVKKCNNKSKYYKEYNIDDDKYQYTSTHRTCEKHRYHKVQCLGTDLGYNWTTPKLIKEKKGGSNGD